MRPPALAMGVPSGNPSTPWRTRSRRGRTPVDASATSLVVTGLRAQVFSGRTEGLRSILTDVTIPPLSTPPIGHGHTGLIRDFIRCIREGDAPQTVCTDNIKSLAMVFGAIASADCRRRVTIEV